MGRRTRDPRAHLVKAVDDVIRAYAKGALDFLASLNLLRLMRADLFAFVREARWVRLRRLAVVGKTQLDCPYPPPRVR